MSRSFKKIPIFGICGHPRRSSEKEDKRLANRHLRHWANQELKEWGEDAILPKLREASNVWSFKHDGKYYHKYLWECIEGFPKRLNIPELIDIEGFPELKKFRINPNHNFRHDDYNKTYKPKDMRK